MISQEDGGFRLKTAISTLPWLSSLLGCRAGFGLASSHDHVVLSN